MTVTPDQFANFAVSSVAGGAGGRGTALGASDTTLYLPTGDGAKMPAAVPFMVQLTQNGSSATNELARCSAIAGDVLTLVRGQEGTTARQWVLGSTVEQVVSAGNLSNLWTQIAALAPTGGVPYYNVKTYGAVGNGSNDDTTAIQNAINAASAAGGGCVYFPAGTYITRTLTLANFVHLRGDGIIATTLKLKSGTNADLLNGGASNVALINLAAAFGTSQTSGSPILQDFSIREMTLDGNKAGQVSGPSYCLRGYVVEYELADLRLVNGFTGGVLLDWNGLGVPTGSNSVESTWHNVKIHDCNGIGLEMGGPSDSVLQDVVIYNTGSHALHLAPNCGGTMCTNVHLWGMATGVRAVGALIESADNYFVGCESEGSDTAQVVLLTESNEWVGGSMYASNGGTNCYGLVLGQTAGGTPYPGSLLQSGGLTTAATAQSNFIDCRFTENRLGAINFVNSAYNHLVVRNNQASGSTYAGNPTSTDTLLLSTRFGDNDSFLRGAFAVGQDTTSTVITNGWTIASGGHAVFRANPGAAVTGIILQTGKTSGQMLTVVNESAFSITFAAAGTSNVADGVSDVIAALTARTFVWDSGTSLWYRLA